MIFLKAIAQFFRKKIKLIFWYLLKKTRGNNGRIDDQNFNGFLQKLTTLISDLFLESSSKYQNLASPTF